MSNRYIPKFNEVIDLEEGETPLPEINVEQILGENYSKINDIEEK